MLKSLIFLVLFGAVATIWAQTPAVNCPAPGDPVQCELPNCRCFSENIPGNIPVADTPQIVYLTFDDGVNILNHVLYEEMLFERVNPNGASISATFFVSHEYTDYSRTNDLWRRGHEIALHSITHKTDQDYWRTLNESGWIAEFVGERDLISHFANIPQADIKGVRAPFLQIGGDPMYKALSENGFLYDSSRATWNFRPRLWPYTNDYKSDQECTIGPCPVGSYPGFWTLPLVDLLGGDLFPCAMLDQCLPTLNTTTEVLNFLKINFLDHYTGNKAPFGIFTHASYLQNDQVGLQRQEGYKQFLDYLASLPDVFIVSQDKAIDWIRTPRTVAEIGDIASWQPTPIIENNCPLPNNCLFSGNQLPEGFFGERLMMSCQLCGPINNYPWLHNPLGQ